MTQVKQTAFRYHDISAGHRVCNQNGACEHLHGHNYRIFFYCEAEQLDSVGRVLDFSEIKSKLCMWLEHNWDHRMILWKDDPWAKAVCAIDKTTVLVPFNPTAENLAEYLLTVIGPKQLVSTGVKLTKVQIDETRKCSAITELTGVVEDSNLQKSAVAWAQPNKTDMDAEPPW